ncbi:MAG: hypothetical protein CSYNP_00545 [Syntrophus sp. SKADARSKE-3]|nr:hypothetical protein [Syntrophus sp. SKADARSKE-3]
MQLKKWLTLLLAAAGIGVMVFYATCETDCSYLQGDIFGIDLKYIGIAFMAFVIGLILVNQTDIIRLLLAGACGGEVVLVTFQFREDVFCPFCLTFGAIIVLLYFIHYSGAQKDDPLARQLLFAPGSATVPFLKLRVPLLAVMVLGFLFMTLFFTGSVTPSYGA